MESLTNHNLINKNNDLIYQLDFLIEKFSYNDFPILKIIFETYFTKFKEIVYNIKKTKKSDTVIAYGNNNFVAKIFIEHLLKNEIGRDNYILINFNAFIHTTEDYIFKKLCNKLNIKAGENGFIGLQKSIEDYYINTTIDKKFVVIYFENIEHLFNKKKQILFYTILEILSVSKNILFVGTTFNFNLQDMMEKRIRSRFSQKTIFISIDTHCSFFTALENLFFNYNSLYKDDSVNLFLKDFFYLLISNEYFVLAFKKYIDLGMGIKEIITKLRYILTLIVLALADNMEIDQTIKQVLKTYETEENTDSYLNLLRNFPKLHIIILVSLYRGFYKHKSKITLGLIYQEYIHYCNTNRWKRLDILQVKKVLEELYNSNIIYIKPDEKYQFLYELKLPADETKILISNLDKGKETCLLTYDIKYFLEDLSK